MVFPLELELWRGHHEVHSPVVARPQLAQAGLVSEVAVGVVSGPADRDPRATALHGTRGPLARHTLALGGTHRLVWRR